MLYRARVITPYSNGSCQVLIPQVYGDVPVLVTRFVVDPPMSAGFGWVTFEGGSFSHPVWLSLDPSIPITAGEIIGEIFRLVDSGGINYLTLDAVQNWPGYGYSLGPSLRMHHNSNTMFDSALAWTNGPTSQTEHSVYLWGPSRNATVPARLTIYGNATSPTSESGYVEIRSSTWTGGGFANEARLQLEEDHSSTYQHAFGFLEVHGRDVAELQVSVRSATRVNKFAIRPDEIVHTVNVYGTEIQANVTPVYVNTANFANLPDESLIVRRVGGYVRVSVNDVGTEKVIYDSTPTPPPSGPLTFNVTNGTESNQFQITATGFQQTINLYGTPLTSDVTMVFVDTTSYNDLPLGALVTDSSGFKLSINSIGVERLIYRASQTWPFPFFNITLGNGTWQGVYNRAGDSIIAQGLLTLGSTSTVGSSVSIDPPVPQDWPMSTFPSLSGAVLLYRDASTGIEYPGQLGQAGNVLSTLDTSGAYGRLTAINTTTPFTWAVGDQIGITLVYPAV